MEEVRFILFCTIGIASHLALSVLTQLSAIVKDGAFFIQFENPHNTVFELFEADTSMAGSGKVKFDTNYSGAECRFDLHYTALSC